MFVMRMALAAVTFLALFAAAAHAGEWRAEEALPLHVSPPPHGQMRSARYVSEGLVKDEEVILAVSPPRWRRGEWVTSDKKRAYAWDPEHYVFMLMSIILTSGQTPILGFDGVSTFPTHAQKDWISFYRPKDAAQKPLAGGACDAHVQQWEYSYKPRCMHACYVTREDLKARRGAVACDSGKAYWIEIQIAREIGGNAPFDRPKPVADDNRDLKWVYEKLLGAFEAQQKEIEAANSKSEPSWLFADRVASSHKLIIKVRGGVEGKRTHYQLDIDDVFRRTLYQTP